MMFFLQRFVNVHQSSSIGNTAMPVFYACLDYKHERFGKWAAGHLNDLNPSVPFRFELMDHRRMA
ncbi:hypothetical protein HanPI659440_Chr12g0453471 [Helianthus annuus]|nr:hypothetical protein HanHA89_Chr05g0204361 [Helianthus annuus]KAJ0724965.1 hypothetical protein HanPI659440_Chr12g0453471 [Helianthus annuus]